jgi:hypothetical protein
MILTRKSLILRTPDRAVLRMVSHAILKIFSYADPMAKEKLIGFWKFRSNRIRIEDGSWLTEHLSGGSMAFSKDEVLVLVRTEQGVWGYSGKYTFDGKQLVITLDVSTSEDIEGQQLTREVKFNNDNEFILSGIESHTGRFFETEVVRDRLEA